MSLSVPIKMSAHNNFRFVIRDVEKGEVVQEAFAYNMVLDNLPALYASGLGPGTSIAYGRGTGILSGSRTTLFDRIGAKTSSLESQSYDPNTGIGQGVRKITILPAEHVGETFTEIGIGNTTVYTHALIEDSEGNPISIGPKTDTQEVTIFLTFYWELGNHAADWLRYIVAEGTYPSRISTHLLALAGAVIDNNINNAFISLYQARMRIHPTVSAWGTQIEGVTPTNKRAANISASGTKRVIPPVRFESGDGNINIAQIGFSTGTDAKNLFAMVSLEALPPEIFAGVQKQDYAIGVGDGATTAFNTSLRDWEDATVKVNGVTQTPGTDYTMYPLPINSAVAEKQIITGQVIGAETTPEMCAFLASSSGIANPQYIFGNSSNAEPTNGSVVILDLGENKKWAFGEFGGLMQYITQVSVEISPDAAGWTSVANNFSIPSPSTSGTKTVVFDSVPVTAFRYVKLTFATSSTAKIRALVFKTKKNQFEFTSPPALDAPITGDFKVKYIPKDSDHMLDIGFALDYGFVNPT